MKCTKAFVMSKLSAPLQKLNLMLAQAANSLPGLGYGVCDSFLLFFLTNFGTSFYCVQNWLDIWLNEKVIN